MRLNVKALAVAGALIWGVLGMLGMGILNLIWPTYGRDFLQVMASVYPGYHATHSITQVIVGALYGTFDGAAGGAIFGWLYNHLVG